MSHSNLLDSMRLLALIR